LKRNEVGEAGDFRKGKTGLRWIADGPVRDAPGNCRLELRLGVGAEKLQIGSIVAGYILVTSSNLPDELHFSAAIA